MKVKQAISNFIATHCLTEKKILVAVSGGIDSVVLLHALIRAGVPVAVAHCNFQLRKQESIDDELFVRQLAAHYQIPFYCKKFSTQTYAREKKISIQMAARELRYNWFEEVRKEQGYDYIATAHQFDDQTETFFINLLRGSGVRGLRGILPVSGHLIRPLLQVTKDEIEQYATFHALTFRNDSSNEKDDYLRNKLRHQLMPLLDSISPSWKKNLAESMDYLSDLEVLLSAQKEKCIKKYIKKQKTDTVISLQIAHEPTAGTLLFEILQPFGFNSSQCRKVISAIQSTPGKQFLSSSHRLIIDRDSLIITPLASNEEIFEYVFPDTNELNGSIHLLFQILNYNQNIPLALPGYIASLDFEKLHFPLVLRKWKQGDRFIPFGMKGYKKISDFLTGIKMPLHEKEKTLILLSDNKIAWVVGHRIDDRFRVTDKTKKVFQIVLKK